ncbi:MAG: ATP-binding protein [Deinococcota bacterium]
MSRDQLSHDELRRVNLFTDLTPDDLSWLAEHTTVYRYPDGVVVFRDGDAIDEMFVIVAGGFVVLANGQVAFRADQGDVSGALPHSRMTHAAAESRTVGETVIGGIHRDHFPQMLAHIPVLDARLAARMSDRIRDVAKKEQQQEKLMALGKLSAGLAHELNNPAAALERTAGALQDRLDTLMSLTIRPMPEVLVGPFEDVLRTASPPDLSSLARSEREDDLSDWLEDRSVDNAWELSESLVDVGLTQETLATLLAPVDEADVTCAVRWLDMLASLQTMSRDMQQAASHIVTLVQSVKTYTHMDRSSGLEPCDVREGLNSTLVMLGHKLRNNNVQVTTHYPDNVPEVPARVGALNQVWTNLIDNAIDAMKDANDAQLKIALEPSPTCLSVTISDNGSGIPEDIQARIFEPFFTTKDVGEGTGLGLDIVASIVKDQHSGVIELESEPGHTAFTVQLPLST